MVPACLTVVVPVEQLHLCTHCCLTFVKLDSRSASLLFVLPTIAKYTNTVDIYTHIYM